MEKKQSVNINLRAVPGDVHEIIVDEKARTEKQNGTGCSNPQAIFQLVRKAAKKKESENRSEP